ncbi:MAG: IS630 family transposase [Alphaproteobacteria bacterium]|nr:MAG: IS630 family transposase [Alphaproteobacteria bacterium]
MWCVPEVTEEFVERMEDVLELYARPPDASEPVVCLDERPVVLHDDARQGLPMQPGQMARRDYEYVRCGTANIFCIIEPLTGRRLTHATKNRTGDAFAAALKKLARRYADAKTIHLVVDNLNTHRLKSLTSALGMETGEALWKRFTLHYTPKHASWLNAAEMEASLVSRECLGRRRIAELPRLKTEVSAWRKRADTSGRKIDWKFRVADARRVFRYSGIITPRSGH